MSASNAVIGDVLTLANYEDWKVRMKSYLKGQSLLEIVEGKENEPTDCDSTYAAWMDKNGKALYAIQISCGTSMLSLIKKTSTAKEAWDRLEVEWKGTWGRRKNNMNKISSQWDKMKRGEKGCNDLKKYRTLYDAAFKDEWKTAQSFLNNNQDAVTARIDKWGNTALHIAAQVGNTQFVEEMVNFMEPNKLTTLNGIRSTALHSVAEGGTKRMAEVMLEKNYDLLKIRVGAFLTPLVLAALSNNQDVLLYLYSQTTVEDLQSDRFNTAFLLRHLINNDLYDRALDLSRCCPESTTIEFFGGTALQVLATKHSAFESGNQLGVWQRLLYTLVQPEQAVLVTHIRPKEDHCTVSMEKVEDVRVLIPKKQALKSSALYRAFFTEVPSYMKRGLRDVLQQLVPGVKQVRRTKLMNIQANELLEHLFDIVLTSENDYLVEEFLGPQLLVAAERGITEFLNMALEKYPRLIEYTDENMWSVLQIAVINRHEKIFDILTQKGRQAVTVDKDIDQNNILHLTGKIAPSHKLNYVSGAALQMQRELQWFKEVEKIAPAAYQMWKNSQGMTPKALFTREHKNLIVEGEKWMKDTATSCSVVSALIITIMFASAFTIPGGVRNDTGTPLFLNTTPFVVFVISDAVALFSSSTSMLMFLSILTARYAEDDFLQSLPTKLIIGLAMLFLSIAAMMGTFSATIFIMLNHHLMTISIILILLAGVPVTLFVLLQFPLFIDILYSTYGSGILR